MLQTYIKDIELTSLFVSMCAAIVFAPTAAYSGEVFDWTATNIQALRGVDYEVGDQERTIVTIEHANGWKYGDNYGFVDITHPDNGYITYYGEFAPRLSVGKILGKDLSRGVFKDVLVSTMLEKPKNQGPRYLYGGALDWNVPGFSFFKTNAFVRDDTQIKGRTWQVTTAWKYPFTLGGVYLLSEGFYDAAGGEGDTKVTNHLIVPRFLVDVGGLIGHKNGKLFAGVEYFYWNNKFGIDGVTESVPQAQIKWNF